MRVPVIVLHLFTIVFYCLINNADTKQEDKNAKNIKQYLSHIPEEQIAKFQKFDYKSWNLEIAQKLQETESMPDSTISSKTCKPRSIFPGTLGCIYCICNDRGTNAYCVPLECKRGVKGIL
ncbi:uncharacterized protein LOC123300896 [Chrysoperla carnea]|uniref:uncharacterized protein LOC123300896 n=1 Tax=Chrysoperla carnea TaxID=189513 RepID=UPI001D05CFB4|nr:uncharacterized protein LOC123300896 [Chrysoperla carnea]